MVLKTSAKTTKNQTAVKESYFVVLAQKYDRNGETYSFMEYTNIILLCLWFCKTEHAENMLKKKFCIVNQVVLKYWYQTVPSLTQIVKAM